MEKYIFESKSGSEFFIEAPLPDITRDSLYVIAAHKTGSVLLNGIIDDICKINTIPNIAIEEQTYSQGIPILDWPNELYSFMNTKGYIYRGFRGLVNLGSVPIFPNSSKAFLVRDPRDVLTSYYFSMKKSHAIPKAGKTKRKQEELRNEFNSLTIDEFVLQGKGDFIINNMCRYINVIEKSKSVRLYKYEDVIFRKKEWVEDLLKFLDTDLTEAQVVEITKKHDIFPDKEDPNKHIRQVKPGNYKTHLGAKSINYIQNKHKEFFEYYGYELF